MNASFSPVTRRYFANAVRTSVSALESLALRRDTLKLLKKWTTPFTVSSLNEVIATFIRKGELEVAIPLYCMGLKRPNFDESSQLGNYLLSMLLPKSLCRTVELVGILQMNRRAVAEYLLDELYERIYDDANVELLSELDTPINLHRIEQAIVRVYLRSGDLSNVIRMLKLAQERSTDCSASVWQEIMEVIIQPSYATKANLMTIITRDTEKRFDLLKQFMQNLKENDAKFTNNAILALENILLSTKAPVDFLTFLNKYCSA